MGTGNTSEPTDRNSLGQSASRYLQQHAHQPVHWQPWSPEAFQIARERDVPVFVSIGYSACHWCHVMAHECFDDPAIAAQMNRDFVNIKVDREEHPDVDAYFMDVVQRISGHGGWPLNAFCTPEGRAFFAGTYFPPQSHPRIPSFPTVLSQVNEWWTSRREEVERQAEALQQAFTSERPALNLADSSERSELDVSLRAIATTLRDSFDPTWGGFGSAPKFPPGMLLAALAQWQILAGDDSAQDMITTTLDRLSHGGIRDVVNGGFARYSVDESWTVPHFEKMLYDQATLLRCFAWAHVIRPDRGYDTVCAEIIEYLRDGLLLESGLFASSHDADTPEGEGRSACWSLEQLVEVLGAEDGARVADHFAVGGPPTFRDPHTGFESWVLRTSDATPPLAGWPELRAALQRATSNRPIAGRDDKSVLSWNALAVRALIDAGEILNQPETIELAKSTAERAWEVFRSGSNWNRVAHGTTSSIPALAQDLSAFAWAATALGNHDSEWFSRSHVLLDACWTAFGDESLGGVRSGHAELVPVRGDYYDNATPSANSLIAAATLQYSAATGDRRWEALAMNIIDQFRGVAHLHPLSFGLLLEAELWTSDVHVQVVITGGEQFVRDSKASIALGETVPLVTVLSGTRESLEVFPLAIEHPDHSVVICTQGTCTRPIVQASGAGLALAKVLSERARSVVIEGS